MSKKYLLIHTGGTIVMERSNDGILNLSKDLDYVLKVAPELKEQFDFKLEKLMHKDSTNMTPADWSTIANCIYENRGKYDGVVVTHGTDTMHFSASAVALALGKNLNFPVVFTGAQARPEVEHGDARVNLLRAFRVASEDLAEVVIAFGEYVFRGCRAQKKDERRFDAFESPAFFHLGYITEQIILSPFARKIRQDRGDIILRNDFSDGVLQVSLIPGMEPELLRTLIDSDKCKGLILQSFGAGNVPDEDKYSLVGVIDHATSLHKPVLITSQFPAKSTQYNEYAPGRRAIDAGAIPTGNMTASCAAAKFRWILAQVLNNPQIAKENQVQEISRLMNKIYIGEMDYDNVKYNEWED